MSDHLVSANPSASTTFRSAAPDDWDAIARLLNDCGLPIAGADAHVDGFLLATRDGRLLGTAALERYGAAALLRSVAVAPEARGTGLGRALVDAAIARARDSGIETLVLLTETAPQFFPRFGFRPISRDDVPDAVRASEEFRGACCATAAVMRLDMLGLRQASHDALKPR
jgi:amino-acid N-acetyltransferase